MFDVVGGLSVAICLTIRAFVLDLASDISEELWPPTCAAFVVFSPFLTLRAFLGHTQRSQYLPYWVTGPLC